MTRTRIDRVHIPWQIRTRFLPIAQENKYLGIIFLFYHGNICCVYALALHERGDSTKYTQRTIIFKNKMLSLETKKAQKNENRRLGFIKSLYIQLCQAKRHS